MSSSLFCELKTQELENIVENSLRSKLNSAKLLTGGLFNTTYLLELETQERFVLRVGPINRHLLMPFEYYLMQSEAVVYELCKRRDVPVSSIVVLDTSKKIIDRDYMIVRNIPSIPMSQAELTAEDRVVICRDIGTAVAKMHSIQQSRFGRIADVQRGKGFLKWSDCLFNELFQWESVAVPADAFTKEEVRKIVELFKKAVPFLDEIHIPRLVHTDLWQGNILIDNTNARPEFAAIIDADRALWGDPDFEFSSIRWAYAENSFWEGYGRNVSQNFATRIRLCVYTLLNRLWNTYVYKIEYNQEDSAKQERFEADKEIQRLERLLNGENSV